MILSGAFSLTDSSSNEKEGVIFLKSGSSLTISGDGILNIISNKNMAINGTDSTFLTINGGNLVIKASLAEAGDIYLRKGITINYRNYSYNGFFSYKHALDSEGNIVIKKGNFSLKPGYGKGIQSKKYFI